MAAMHWPIAAWTLCVAIGWTGASLAAPASDANAIYERARTLDESGDPEGALQVIDGGLPAAPKHLDLLRLKGKVLIELDDLPGARAAFQEFLAAGATGKDAREIQQIVNDLTPVLSTFLDIAVDNEVDTGPARIYVDSMGGRLLCSAAPVCHRAMMPRVYTLTAVAERPGFERWTGQITIERDKTATLRITLVQRPSLLTVTVTPPGARIAVDGATYGGPITVAAGKHRVVVVRTGYVEQQQEVTASAGNPVSLAVALAPRVPVRINAPQAMLALDDQPIEIVDGGIAVSPGTHMLVASARGFHDSRIAIPAGRPPDYRIDVELAPVESVAAKPPPPVEDKSPPPVTAKPPSSATAKSPPVVPAKPPPPVTPKSLPLAAAAPPPQGAGHNPTAALLLSLGGTAASWGMVVAATQEPRGSTTMWTLGTIGAAGTLFGPSFGHWYAPGTNGFVLRVLGVAAALPGAVGCFWDRVPECGSGVQVAGVVGGALYVIGTIEDIVNAPGDARDHRSPPPRATVVPMLGGDRGGLAIAGRF